MIFSFFQEQEQEKEKYLFFEINFKTGKIWLKIFCKPTSFYNTISKHSTKQEQTNPAVTEIKKLRNVRPS